MNTLEMLLADGKVEMLFRMSIVPLAQVALFTAILDFAAWKIKQERRRRRRNHQTTQEAK